MAAIKLTKAPAIKTRLVNPRINAFEHARRGHFPHDPDCTTCRLAHRRLPAAKATKAGHVIRGSTRGYVLGVDFSGPYPESNDGETYMYAIQGVEVGHTDLSLIHFCKDKSGPSADVPLTYR
jgi:hypothetical protein